MKPDAALAARCEAFDLLATMVALVNPQGSCLYANTAFENVLGLPRRAVLKARLQDWFTDPEQLEETVRAVARNQYATGRFDAQLKRPSGHASEMLPVQVIVNQTESRERVVVEMIEIEQQTRFDRE